MKAVLFDEKARVVTTMHEVKQFWLYTKLLNLDYRGIGKNKFELAKAFGILDVRAMTMGKAMLNVKVETWCAIVHNANTYSEEYDYFYKLKELLKALKTVSADTTLQFGYNKYMRRDEYEEKEGIRILYKVIR